MLLVACSNEIYSTLTFLSLANRAYLRYVLFNTVIIHYNNYTGYNICCAWFLDIVISTCFNSNCEFLLKYPLLKYVFMCSLTYNQDYHTITVWNRILWFTLLIHIKKLLMKCDIWTMYINMYIYSFCKFVHYVHIPVVWVEFWDIIPVCLVRDVLL